MRYAWAVVLALVLAGCSEADAPPADEDELALEQELRATETTGVIRGIVIDDAIVPVAGVTVNVTGTTFSTRSNDNGAFGFDGLAPGTYFLHASKAGFNATQVAATVVAGVDSPPIVKIQLQRDPSTGPYVEPIYFHGFLACGAAVFYTSVGCTTFDFLSQQTESTSIWSVDFTTLPRWMQGEMVWEDTQPASGQMIWQIVKSNDPDTPQLHIGYMETTPSPALAYVPTEVIDEYADWILDRGVDYRFFAGPHELCPQHVGDPAVNRFGCGAVVEQDADIYIHHFYNTMPVPGWRFTSDGAPQ